MKNPSNYHYWEHPLSELKELLVTRGANTVHLYRIKVYSKQMSRDIKEK